MPRLASSEVALLSEKNVNSKTGAIRTLLGVLFDDDKSQNVENGSLLVYYAASSGFLTGVSGQIIDPILRVIPKGR
jgi:hypothetical protein